MDDATRGFLNWLDGEIRKLKDMPKTDRQLARLLTLLECQKQLNKLLNGLGK